jgi:hypothetical protein
MTDKRTRNEEITPISLWQVLVSVTGAKLMAVGVNKPLNSSIWSRRGNDDIVTSWDPSTSNSTTFLDTVLLRIFNVEAPDF